jgi:hypothetical protein
MGKKKALKIRPIPRYCWKCDTLKNFNFYERKGKREVYICETCYSSYDVTVG